MQRHLSFVMFLGFLVSTPSWSFAGSVLPAEAQSGACSTLAGAPTLSVGMKHPAVAIVQSILDKDPATLVAASGPGSLGNETTLFGPATKAAVIRFQEKYKAAVLTPAGLAHGTGIIGPLSRAKLVALCQGTTGTGSGTASSSSTHTTAKTNTAAPILTPLSDANIQRGATVRVYGTGLTTERNTVTIGSVAQTGIRSLSGLSFVVKVPTTAQSGATTLSVSNANGTSNSIPLVIIRNPAFHPVIRSVTPATGPIGTTVTLRGRNFTKTGNTIITTGGRFTADSADGTTISFRVTLPSVKKLPTKSVSKTGTLLPFMITVQNENGVSHTQVFFLKL